MFSNIFQVQMKIYITGSR